MWLWGEGASLGVTDFKCLASFLVFLFNLLLEDLDVSFQLLLLPLWTLTL